MRIVFYPGSACSRLQKYSITNVSNFHCTANNFKDNDGENTNKAQAADQRNAKASETKQEKRAKAKSKQQAGDKKPLKAAVLEVEKLEGAQLRLKSLLKGFSQEPSTAETKPVNLSRPKGRTAKTRKEKVSPLEAAAAQVAESFKKADKEVVKKELLERVKKAEDGLPAYDRGELLSAISGIKLKFQEEEGKRKQDEIEKKENEATKQAMEQEKQKEEKEKRRERTKSKMEDEEGESRPREFQLRRPLRVSLFGAQPLGTFTAGEKAPAPSTQETGLSTWNAAKARELKVMVTHAPTNGIEEMIQWTEQGKLWKFPIDNEYGLDEEHSVGFHQHIFLEPHLEPWSPKAGPVRHFMELVCVGLSKNPWLTVEEKKRHIMWFKDYFAGKANLLKETGAIDASGAEKLLKQISV